MPQAVTGPRRRRPAGRPDGFASLEAIAPTLRYGAACLGDSRPPAVRLAKINKPTLVLTGTTLDPHMRGLRSDVFDRAADTIAAIIPGAQRQTVDDQTHMVDAKALAPILERFFGGNPITHR